VYSHKLKEKKIPCLFSRQGKVAKEVLAVSLIFFYIIESILAVWAIAAIMNW
jgi:hypothetical protein